MSDPIAFARPQDWNDWLAQNPQATEVWVLFHKKATGVPSLTWETAVIEALAHGWIDGVRKTVNETQWMQRYTPRKPRSIWSAKNVATVERLIAEGRMTTAGLAAVQAGKAAGQWDLAYGGSGPNGQIPQDFLDALAAAAPSARDTFAGLNSANRYAITHRLITAKRPETRLKRIADFVAKLTAGQPIL